MPSEAAGYKNLEAQALTKTILGKLGAKENIIADVCTLIDHALSAQDRTHPGYRILADAQVLAALEEENKLNRTHRGPASPGYRPGSADRGGAFAGKKNVLAVK